MVSSYAAFLRGMNVGGHRLTNVELCKHFTKMGFRDVASFRASGNVIFAGEKQPDDAVAARIEQGLEKALGYAVPTFIRSAEEVRAIATHEPFERKHVEASTGKLQVALLGPRPSAADRKAVLALASDADRLTFGGRELYWLPCGGMSDSELDLKEIERRLGAMTVRTKGTVEQIASKHFTDGG
ncbi:MAG TPA: DUF1697 domain-containing protein [Solirubrobacteraceae bacterium]|nr:DUF1697 domain-containing protein [Solirubrobacteraceae bacterium]